MVKASSLAEKMESQVTGSLRTMSSCRPFHQKQLVYDWIIFTFLSVSFLKTIAPISTRSLDQPQLTAYLHILALLKESETQVNGEYASGSGGDLTELTDSQVDEFALSSLVSGTVVIKINVLLMPYIIRTDAMYV